MFWFGVNPRKVISRGSETPKTSLEINGRLKVFLITYERLICALIHLLSSDSKNENNTV